MISRIRTRVQQLYRRFLLHRMETCFISSRKQSIKKTDLIKKLANTQPLTPETTKEISQFWGNLLHSNKFYDKRYFEVYNKLETDKSRLKYYVPDDFWMVYFDSFFSNPTRCVSIDNKNFYDLFFHDIKQPKTIARRTGNILCDANYQPISIDQTIELCQRQKKVIIKEAVGSYGGKGIQFWNIDTDDADKLKKLVQGKDFIIQEIIKQSSTLSAIHANSINTVRIMVLIHKGEPIILSSVLRMGRNNAKVDNASSGGIVCGINNDGRLKDFAVDTSANIYKEHPQGGILSQYVVPNFEKVCNLVKELSIRFSFDSKLQSWDFAIDENNEPVLIECNLCYGEVDFHQMCNGPLLGDRTEEIISYVVKHSHMLQGKTTKKHLAPGTMIPFYMRDSK